MGLMATVIFGTETPVNVSENGLIVEINCSEDTAAYVWFPLNMEI